MEEERRPRKEDKREREKKERIKKTRKGGLKAKKKVLSDGECLRRGAGRE